MHVNTSGTNPKYSNFAGNHALQGAIILIPYGR